MEEKKAGKTLQHWVYARPSTDSRLHGVHDGKNGGRACWVIAGTLCGGTVQGTFGTKYKTCEQCDFYQNTRAEERSNFKLSVLLLNKLKSAPAAAAQV